MAKETLLSIRKRLGLTRKQTVAKCSKCGKTIIVPNLVGDELNKVLNPFCCASTVFMVQWLIHHGWHIRDLGLHDSHPYFCPDCWVEDGTPEYTEREYGEAWCQQAQKWMYSKD